MLLQLKLLRLQLETLLHRLNACDASPRLHYYAAVATMSADSALAVTVAVDTAR